MKKWLFSIVGLGLAVVLLSGGLFLLLSANDARQDRKHTVVVKSSTPVFVGAGSEQCGGKGLTILQPGTTLSVQRIRYWKNCATLDIALPDNRLGHIVLGEGDVSIIPPLNANE